MVKHGVLRSCIYLDRFRQIYIGIEMGQEIYLCEAFNLMKKHGLIAELERTGKITSVCRTRKIPFEFERDVYRVNQPLSGKFVQNMRLGNTGLPAGRIRAFIVERLQTRRGDEETRRRGLALQRKGKAGGFVADPKIQSQRALVT